MDRVLSRPLVVLDEVVNAFGWNYVYPHQGCQYVKNGKPACIVGQVISKMDPPEGLLARMDAGGMTAFQFLMNAARRMVEGDVAKWEGISLSDAQWLVRNFDRETTQALSVAQQVQDRRDSWGRASDKAKSRFEELTHNG